MDAKKIGMVILVVSIALLVVFVLTSQNLSTESEQLGCFSDENCQPVQQSLSLVNVGFGFFGFILALGFYLVFFSKGNEALLNKLESEGKRIDGEERFSILLMGLDDFEKKVVQEVKKQQGITQNTLRLRTDMSKSKLSQVLSGLEKKGLVVRKQQGKTLAVFSKVNL